MKGIDISKWQGKIDWSSVNNIDFVYIRASIGVGTHDEFLNTNANAVYSSGLKIGYYHFATLKPSSEQDPANRAAEEANYFISLIKNLPAPTMPIALDIEENPVGLTKDEVLSYIHAFLGVLKK
jgi:lysozyme